MKSRRLILLTAVGYGIYLAALRRRHLRWGASDDEVLRDLSGDDLVPWPRLDTTRAVTIQAPASEVWPWIVQIGQGRGGFYTYDWLENLAGLNIHSVDRIIPEFQRLEAGDAISLAPKNAMPLNVEAIDPPRLLLLRTGKRGSPAQPGDFFRGQIAGTWAFILEDVGPGASRLIVRFRADWASSVGAWAFNHFVGEPAHFIMERRMLLGIKERAERRAGSDSQADE